MTKPNKYSKKAWMKPNRGSKTRHMAKQRLGNPELPWQYELKIQEFETNMAEYHQAKVEQHAKQQEGVILNIVYDKEEDLPKGPRESGYDMYQK